MLGPLFSTFTESAGMSYTFTTLASPVGELKLVAKGTRLAAILWENDKPGRVKLGPMTEAADNPILVHTTRQLQEYFAGTRNRFELELDFAGTEFQQKGVAGVTDHSVWRNAQLQRDCPADRQSQCGSGGGRG